MDYKSIVLGSLPSPTYYESRFPRWKVGNVVCPFHEDRSPSLALNLRGGGAKCHASSCGVSLGNIVHFEAKLKKVSEARASRELYFEFVRKKLDLSKLLQLKSNIRKFGASTRLFIQDTGLSLNTIEIFDIGFDEPTKRFTFPIFSPEGDLLNIRFYKTPSMRGKDTKVKIYNLDGYGGKDLFPWKDATNYRTDLPLFWMASEREVMLARQGGLQAACSTTGEGSWDESWNEWISKFDVVLALDVDKGGQDATKKLEKMFANLAKSVKSIRLNLKNKENKDFADWVIKEGNKPADLLKLAPKNRDMKVEVDDKEVSVKPTLTPSELRDLHEISSNPSLLGRTITVRGLVSTKANRTYLLPYKFKIKAKGRAPFELKLPVGRELAHFAGSSDQTIRDTLASIIGNQVQSFEVLKSVNAAEVEVIPIAVADRDFPYIVQPCLVIGESLNSNTPYEFKIIPISTIKSQCSIGLIIEAKEVASTIDLFDLKANLQILQKFKPVSDVWSHAIGLAKDLSVNHTKIYQRDDWHLIALLTWLSPLQFRFEGDSEMQRGWMNTLIVGDTQTGKSQVAKKMIEVLKAGAFASAENCTYVGMVGGAIKMSNGQFGLRWGRIPLGDRRLVVLEELTGLSTEDIANMSDVRSSGVAQLDKGGISGQTNARTRLLCLSNPRSRSPLSQFLFGVTAIQGVVGQPEDLARFDLVGTLVDKEVSNAVINGDTPELDTNFEGNDYATLCRFAWSLKGEQVVITQQAADKCKELTLKLSKKYHPSVPIFKGGSGRFRLARIANAFAVLCFSYRKDTLIVKPTHVEAAAKLLQMCYDKPSLAYDVWSRQLFDKERIVLEDELRKAIQMHIPVSKFNRVAKSLIHALRFNRDELCAYAGVSITVADFLISHLCNSHVVIKGESNQWAITPSGKRWLENEHT